MLLRRIHVSFLSNVKLRVWAPKTEDEEDKVVYGDGTSAFYSSNYQRYAVTFEQR